MSDTSLPTGAVDKQPATVELAELTPPLRHDAVRVLADAFLHDPAWVAIGPRRDPARGRLLQRYYGIVVGEALRWGGPHWCALRNGTVVGVALTYADGTRFPAAVCDAARGRRRSSGPGPARPCALPSWTA